MYVATQRPWIGQQEELQGQTKKLTEYGMQLLEKQRLRAYYGVMEKQFTKYVKDAIKSPEQTGHALIKTLETRLDNLTYRMGGFASSIRQARQMVVHGHILVNGKKDKYTILFSRCWR